MAHVRHLKKETPGGHIWKKLTGFLTVIWMVVIFAFSAQPAPQSSQVSGGVAYKIAEWQNDLFRSNKTEAELSVQAESMQLVIRKAAHMTEYALLAVLLYFHFSYYPVTKKQMLLLVLGITAGYAATDELHQIFVPGRAGRFSDICIDSLGGALGILFCLIIKKRLFIPRLFSTHKKKH